MVSEHASPLAALGGADAGGQNVHVAALASGLARRGHDVTVFTRRDDAGLDAAVSFAPGVTVEHVPAGPARHVPKDELAVHMPVFGAWLRERWSPAPPDVVHAHFWMSGLAAVRAASGAVPVVQTFHALGLVKRRHQARADTSPPGRIAAEREVGRRAAAIIATCTDEVRELAGYGVPPERTYVVPCGVDCDRFRPDGPADSGGLWPGASARPRPWPSGADAGPRLRVLTLGRQVPRKGTDTIIAALAQLPQADLVVAGGPPAQLLGADPEIARLRSAAAAAGVADRVRFAGQVPHASIPALIRSADVVACDPWYEPFGMVTLEAMACGVAVVASAVGGHLDTVSDGTTGLLVPPRDPAALAARLRDLLAWPDWRRSLAAAAARHARGRYRWEQIAAETEAVYGWVRAAASAGRESDGVRS